MFVILPARNEPHTIHDLVKNIYKTKLQNLIKTKINGTEQSIVTLPKFNMKETLPLTQVSQRCITYCNICRTALGFFYKVSKARKRKFKLRVYTVQKMYIGINLSKNNIKSSQQYVSYINIIIIHLKSVDMCPVWPIIIPKTGTCKFK